MNTSPTSFLFVANELHLNEDPDDGGTTPRFCDLGRWRPPILTKGYGRQEPGQFIYRWANNGEISIVSACEGYDARGTLVEYGATTMFYCDNHTGFLLNSFDTSTQNLEVAEAHNSHWRVPRFHHERPLSRLDCHVGEPELAGAASRWVFDLGLQNFLRPESYADNTPHALAGNLSAIVALVAFSCRPGDLHAVLTGPDPAWSRTYWTGHDFPYRRK